MKEFEDVCQEEYQAVLKFLTRLCYDDLLAQELTQETFLQAMKNWQSFAGRCSVYTWLCTIAKRTYWQSMRRQEHTVDFPDMRSDEPDFADRLAQKEQAMLAHHRLHQLPEPYREVFTLRTFCELSHQQIGMLFGKTEGWARVTYYRAKVLLRQEIKEESEP